MPGLDSDSIDAVSSASGTATPLSWTHVIGVGDDRVLLVAVGIRKESNPRPTVTGITFRGLALTQIVTQPNVQKTSSDWWILVNPPQGSGSVVVTLSSTPTQIIAGAISVFNADQLEPIGQAQGNSGNSNLGGNVILDSGGGNLVFGTIATVDTITLGPNQTSNWSVTLSSLRSAASYELGGDAATSVTWVIGSTQQWTSAAITVRPKSEGTATGVFTGGGVRAVPELWIATLGNARHTNISDQILDGYVEMNVDRAVKLQLQVKLRDPGVLTAYTDYLAPFMSYRYEDGREATRDQLGLYGFKLPPGDYTTASAEATIVGNDMVANVFDYYPETMVTHIAGQSIHDAIELRLLQAGLVLSTVPDFDDEFDDPESVPIDVNFGDMINSWLTRTGFYSLHMTLDGYVTTLGEYKEANQTEPFATYTDTDLYTKFSPSRSENQVYNTATAMRDDNTLAPLKQTFSNDDPASKSSTVNIGRRPVPTIKVPSPTSSSKLLKIARKAVRDGARFYQTASFSVLPDPAALIPGQTVYLDFDANGKMAAYRGLWQVRTAKIGLTPATALMQLEVSQSKLFDGSEI